MMQMTSCINVISIEQTARAFFVAFWLVVREKNNFRRFIKNI